MTGRPRIASAVSIDIPRLLLKYASGRGLDTAAVCQAIGLEPAALRDPAAWMPSDQFGRLWAEVARRTADPALALHFGEAIPGLSSGHILPGVMLNCATLEAALGRFCRYHGLLSDLPAPELRDEDGRVVFRLAAIPTRQGYYPEAVLAMLMVMVRNLTEVPVRPVEVRLVTPMPPDPAEHQRIFDAPLLFGQPDSGLVFRREDLSASVFLANPAVLQALDRTAAWMVARLATSTAWTNQVGQLITQLMTQGETPRLPMVARALAVSPRHLQNKLRAEGLTFQELLDTLRRQMAVDCLQRTDMSLADIAFLLGFSEQSAFNHAFRRWTGTSPGELKAADPLPRDGSAG